MPTKRTTRSKSKKRDQDGIYERDDSPFWWCTYTDASGKTARRSTGVRREDDPRKERAKAVRAQWIVEAAEERKHGPRPAPATGPTFDELMAEYMEGPSLDKKDPVRDHYSLKQLAPVFGGRELATLTRADARNYIAKRRDDKMQDATIRKEIGMFSAALNWARTELEWDVPNPFRSCKLQPAKTKDRWLKPEEADALLKAARNLPRAKHLADFIKLGLYAGLRPGEILGLEWSRVDLIRGLIYFGPEDQKNGKAGSVPINAQAREAILARASFRASWCPDSPWVFADRHGDRIACVKKSFHAARGEAGLGKDVTPHTLRRTCGSWLAQKGVPIQRISAFLRHSDIRVTDRVYAHLSQDSLREVATVLEVGAVSRSGFTHNKKA